jgi:hypothetical protein
MIAMKSTAAALAVVFTLFAVSEAKPTPNDTEADNSTLASLLKQEGFGVVKLKQANLDRDPKRLVVDVVE